MSFSVSGIYILFPRNLIARLTRITRLRAAGHIQTFLPLPLVHPQMGTREVVNMKKAARTSSPSGFTSVGMTGFEPATLCSQNRCATKLRHIPRRRQSNHMHGLRCTSIRTVFPNGMQLTTLDDDGAGGCDAGHLQAIWRRVRMSTIVVYATRGCSSMVEPQSSKLMVRVRFPSSPPLTGRTRWSGRFFSVRGPACSGGCGLYYGASDDAGLRGQ